MKWQHWRTALLGMAVVSGLSIGLTRQLPATDEERVDVSDAFAVAEKLSTAFETVAEDIKRSVVSVQSQAKPMQMRFGRQGQGQAPGQGQGQNPFRGTPFEHFFDQFQFGGPMQPQPQPRQGLGSGVVVDEDGHVLTNNHVVQGVDKVTVTLWDDRTVDAEVVGADPRTDLAVLKVQAKNLHPAKLGRSDDLRVGEWVLAAGNPFGLSSTVTAGIVSATGRSRMGIADYEDFIQTDAAINPGNSGGPLVNLKGEVVGINTAIFSRSGGNMGVGFAIPIDMARSVVDSLLRTGEVERGWLGVTIQDLTPGLARSFGFEGRNGVVIGDVVPGGPAAEVGLQSGDIVTRLDGEPMNTTDELRNLIARKTPGTTVELDLFRQGQSLSAAVELGKLPEEALLGGAQLGQRGPEAQAPSRTLEKLGLTVGDPTPEVLEQFSLASGIDGAVVTGVEPFGPANQAGFRAGDVVVEVQGDAIRNASDLQRALDRHDLKEGVRFTVSSGGSKRFLFLQVDE